MRIILDYDRILDKDARSEITAASFTEGTSELAPIEVVMVSQLPTASWSDELFVPYIPIMVDDLPLLQNPEE